MVESVSKNHVFVVEDNYINSRLTVSMLERLGLDVTTANNGQEALDLLRQGIVPDLILMDLQMPIMDGIEATKIIQISINLAPPIIAMSANVNQAYQQECSDIGMVDFIEKPIKLANLRKILPRHLPTMLLNTDVNLWQDDSHFNEGFFTIDIIAIEKDFSECWDIFYKLYRDFIHYYQDQLPELEKFIKQKNDIEIHRACKDLIDLAKHFHPFKLIEFVEDIQEQAAPKDYAILLSQFRIVRTETQSVIRELSLLFSNESQKLSQ